MVAPHTVQNLRFKKTGALLSRASKVFGEQGPKAKMWLKVGTFHSLGMFDGPVHGTEEGAAVLHQAVEVHLLQEVALGLAEVFGVKPFGQTGKTGGQP